MARNPVPEPQKPESADILREPAEVRYAEQLEAL